MFVSIYKTLDGLIVSPRHGASWHFTARHGAAGASRCATWYMVRTGQRAVHVASLMEAFMGHLIRSISLLMSAIPSIESPRAPTFFSYPRERSVMIELFISPPYLFSMSKLNSNAHNRPTR